MSQPLPPLFQITTDVARQSVLDQVLVLLQDLNRKVDILMSQDASVAAAAARIEADEEAVLAALRSQQALLEALQAEVAAGNLSEVAAGNLSQATLDALSKAQADMGALRTEAEADVAANVPPSAAPAG